MDDMLKHINVLRNKIGSPKVDSEVVFSYFLDNLGENEEFFLLGKNKKNKLLKTILKVAAENYFQKKVVITRFCLTFIKQRRFYHGVLKLNEFSGSVLFFEDLNMGVMSIVISMQPAQTIFVHFSATEFIKTKEVSVSSIRNDTIH